MARMLGLSLVLLALISAHPTSSQSNYALQAIDVEYGNGLPPTATLDGKVTELDSLKPQISLNRTSADLNCAAGSMHVQLKFKQPFYGIAYSDFDRYSACHTQGTGDLTGVLELPLKGCGTKQDPARVFTNNVVVRFHPGLEMEGDEVITVVCRYPPPIVPAPPIPLINLPPPVPTLVPKPLNELEVLMIICTLLFLGLMLLGLACSTYCLKQRNIQVIRKRPFTPIDDESEQVSTIESFQQLKIPRVHPPSTSSSEPPMEQNLASDYPSSLDEPIPRPETASSEYSDTHVQIETETIPAAVISKQKFEVNLRVAQQPREHIAYEREGSITSIETGTTASEITVSDLHPPARRAPPPPPVFRKTQDIHLPQRHVQSTEYLDHLTVVDRQEVDTATHYTKPIVIAKKPEVSVHTVDDVYLQTIVERRLIEDEERKTIEVTQFYKKDQPKWDVVIKTHPTDDDDNWERGSETTEVSSIGWSAVEEPTIHPNYTTINRDHLIRRNEVHHEESDRVTVTRAMQKLRQDDTQIWNEKWKVLLRVLDSSPPPEFRPDTDDESDVASVLTQDDRDKWRQIISTESTLRTLLTEATYREDYERIRRDTRYERLFEPEKWDVIIHVLAPPHTTTDTEDRFYSDSTSEVSSSSGSPLKPSRMYRKKSSDTNITESRSITDVRSMTEMTVDFGVDERMGDDSSSVSSVPGAARSIGTEIVEFAPIEMSQGGGGMESSNTFTRRETRVTQQSAGTSSSTTGFVQQQSSSSSTLYSTRTQRQ
ncbi:uncharacterized protein LOC110845675 isoform X2 [Folsomia candida]|uniref:uncharacterized protein LOC110845675 isoform X2 n=1 Tax=Folsomia candida TaxID=158441 RepID=UPI000B906FD2|nr:uncharacterized protein LOC110845675 isoform X2 [Folsomia candida]